MNPPSRSFWLVRVLRAAAVALVTLSLSLASAQSAERILLWRVVQACVVNAKITGGAFPCLDVNIKQGVEDGYAVVRAPGDSTHIVLVPTARVAGVEDRRLGEADTTNYFEAAWQARHFVEGQAPHPLKREDLGLALNSRPGRSQDQLHIHVDCIDPAVRDLLRKHGSEIHTDIWSRLPFTLHDERYWGLKLKSADLKDINVFQLVANGLHVAEADRSKVTIVLAGASFEPGGEGFYLLAAVASHAGRNHGHGEFLLDNSCASY